jgi:hypothetical protein
MNNIISGNFIKNVNLIYKIYKHKTVSNEIIAILINSKWDRIIDGKQIPNWFLNKDIFILILKNEEFNFSDRKYIILYNIFYHKMYNEAFAIIEENIYIIKPILSGNLIDKLCIDAKTNPLCIEIIKKIYDNGICYITSIAVCDYLGAICNFHIIGILLYHLGDEYNKYLTNEYLININDKDNGNNRNNIISIFTSLNKKEDAIKFANLGVDYKNANIRHNDWFENLDKDKKDKKNEDDTMGAINKDELILEIKRKQDELAEMIAKLSVIK